MARIRASRILLLLGMARISPAWLPPARVRPDFFRQATSIDLQSDTAQFGRGEMHLSALLEDGDVVVYQTGTWYVDGVEVGTGEPASFAYAVVDNVQVVWTHN